MKNRILGNILPTFPSNNGMGKTILDFVFRDNALILRDAGVILTGATFPLPLIGFQYETPTSIDLLNYSYSTYTFLNRSVIANSSVKETCEITITAYRVLIGSYAVEANYLTNELIIKTLDAYCMRGGRFILLTMWGAINNLVLTKLKGIKAYGNDMGGVGFEFNFKQLNFTSKSTAKKLSSKLSKLASGGL